MQLETKYGTLEDISANALAYIEENSIDVDLFALWFLRVLEKRSDSKINVGHPKQYLDEGGEEAARAVLRADAVVEAAREAERKVILGHDDFMRLWVDRRFGNAPVELRGRLKEALVQSGLRLRASHVDSLRAIIINKCQEEGWLIHDYGSRHGQVLRTDDNADQFIYHTFVGDIYATVQEDFNGRMIQSLSNEGQHHPIDTQGPSYYRALMFALDLGYEHELITIPDWEWLNGREPLDGGHDGD